MLEPYAELIRGKMDFTGTQAELLANPIGVGGVGGSGTRSLAAILTQAGVSMAAPLNKALDALQWPPYDSLLVPSMTDRFPRDLIIHNALHVFEKLLLYRQHRLGLTGRIGWKVPDTCLWLREFAEFFPEMNYVHLVRSGLDMAYSSSQNHTHEWAEKLDVQLDYGDEGRILPASMLECWLRANEQTLETGRELLPGRMLVVRFEDLCAQPEDEIARLCEFLSLSVSSSLLRELAALVRIPRSVGRYRSFDWKSDLGEEQLQRLEVLGYTP